MELARTLVHALGARAASLGSLPALLPPGPRGARAVSWAELQSLANRFGRALLAEGLQPGETVALAGTHGVGWHAAALGALGAGAVLAPLPAQLDRAEASRLLGACSARWLVAGAEALAAVREPRSRPPALRRIVALDPTRSRSSLVLGLNDFLALAEPVPATALQERLEGIGPESPAFAAFTSGTTGARRPVVSSHGANVWLAERLALALRAGDSDTILSGVPSWHPVGFAFSISLPLVAGAALCLGREGDEALQDLLAARPTVVVAAGRVWERLDRRLAARVAGDSASRRSVQTWAREAMLLRQKLEQARQVVPPTLAARCRLAGGLVTAPLRQELGLVHARALVSAGPVRAEALESLASLDLPVFECYGLAEAAGVVACNVAGSHRHETVGRPLPGVEVRIADDGEILLRAGGTRAGDVDPAGWLHTGDLGALDEDGFLFVYGRRDEQLADAAAGGEGFPRAIEARLRGEPLVSDVAVVRGPGGKPFAIVALEISVAARICAEAGVPPTLEAAARCAPLRERLEAAVERVNRRLPMSARLSGFRVLDRPMAPSEIGPLGEPRRGALAALATAPRARTARAARADR